MKKAIYCKQCVDCGWVHAPIDAFCKQCGGDDLKNIYVGTDPDGCNRQTNSPCDWSNTDIMDDICKACGRDFPTWS